jgi:hypothetical protein
MLLAAGQNFFTRLPRMIPWPLLFGAILFASSAPAQTAQRPRELPQHVEGKFTRNGVYPTTRWIFGGARPRMWGSWSGSDKNIGSLTVGPFRVKPVFRLAFSGFPTRIGNELYLQRVRDGARLNIADFDAGSRWMEQIIYLPPDWRGELIELHAVDRSTASGGWLGITEPYDPAMLSWQLPNVVLQWWGSVILAYFLSALFFAITGLASLSLVRRFIQFENSFVPLAGVALVALAGYAIFWIYWLNPTAGKIASYAFLALSLARLSWLVHRGGWARVKNSLGGWDALLPCLLTLLIGLLYLGILCLWQSDDTLHFKAQRRFFHYSLPSDNEITQIFAEKLSAGQDPRALIGDWQSSDRPPLEAGGQLLYRPIFLALRFDGDTADQIPGLLLQLSWVAAAWAFLRTAKFSLSQSAWIVASIAATGFLYSNSIYIWPKLLAAALSGGAFTLLLQRRQADSRPETGRVIFAASMAGLAVLSHGGAIFALFAIGLTLLLPRYWLGIKLVALGCVVFFALNLPWIAYQTFYDPPGNRLVKWHLAGTNEIEPRGVARTLLDSYASAGWRQVVLLKQTNLQTLFVPGDYLQMFSLAPATAEDRRRVEFYTVFRTFGVFSLGWFVAFIMLAKSMKRSTSIPPPHGPAELWLSIVVSMVTFGIWTMLMFGPSSTVIHLGPYFPILILFATLAGLILRFSRWLFMVVSLFNLALFLGNYLLPSISAAVAVARLDWIAALVALTGAAGVGLLLWKSRQLANPEPGLITSGAITV